MKFQTHGQQIGIKDQKQFLSAWVVCFVGLYVFFLTAAGLCLVSGGSVILALFLIFFLPCVLAFLWLMSKDMAKAYVELQKDKVCVVDYYLGFKKEQQFPLSQITSAEVCMASSPKVKGYRNYGAMEYIVLRNGEKYLFKVLHTPTAAEVFRPYLP